MGEDTMNPENRTGADALASLIGRLCNAVDGGRDAADVAAEAWPDFKLAVLAAQEEDRAEERAGVARWLEKRYEARRAKEAAS